MSSRLRYLRVRREGGYTLVELLVSMALGLVVAGSLMTFITFSLGQQNAVASRTNSTTQGELGATQFVRDLREAQSIPVATSTSYPFGNETPLVINYTTGSSAGFTARFYIPTSVSSGGYSAAPAPGTAVTWTCTAASGGTPGTCTRTVGGVSRLEIPNLLSATITPQNTTVNPIPTATIVGGVPTPPGSPPEYPTYVAVSFELEVVSSNDATQTHSLTGTVNPIVIQEGVDVRSYS